MYIIDMDDMGYYSLWEKTENYREYRGLEQFNRLHQAITYCRLHDLNFTTVDDITSQELWAATVRSNGGSYGKDN